MPQAPTLPEGHKAITSWDEAIQAIAKQYQVDPRLALAVAQKESALDPNAQGDGHLEGGSVGFFQLRPAAAQDMGVNRDDPLENIVGGVKYLKTLSDRYRDPSTGQSDVQKILMAYNGGPDNVDKGTISPAAQAYAADVIASISKGVRTAATAPQAAQGATPAPAPTTGAPAAPVPLQGNVAAKSSIQPAPGLGEEAWRAAKAVGRDVVLPAAKAVASSMDPRTPEGRQNIAVTAGTGLATYVFPPTMYLRMGVAPWLARILTAPAVAGTIGTAEAAAENVVGTSTENPLTAGAMQATYELGGQAFIWPFRTAAKDLAASTVGRQARETLTTSLRNVRRSGQVALDTLRTTLRGTTDAVRDAGAAKVSAVKEMGESATKLASDTAGARLAKVELENAARVADITEQYERIRGQAPSSTAPGELAREVVGGRPGLTNLPTGPASRAIDIAGERVRAAAESGPMIDVRPIQRELGRMGADTLPTSILERRAAAMAEPEAAMAPGQVRFDQLPPARQKALQDSGIVPAGSLLPTDHPLPKVLGEFQKEGMSSVSQDGKIPFVELHKWKTLIDSAVNQDRAAKDLVERLSKGLRGAIRDAMAVHEPYNVATEAYSKLIPLYTDGIGQTLIDAAAHNPDKVAQLLNVKEAGNAAALRALLVDQSAAGGNVEIGQRAWDAVRSRFTYDKIVHGGIEGLADRVKQVATENPEFTRIVFGDMQGASVLSNLDRIGQAYQQAVAETGARTASTKAIGKAGVEEARMVASHAVDRTSEEAAKATRAATGRGQTAFRAASREIQRQKEGLSEKLENLSESSVGPYVTRQAGANVAANLARVALTPKSPFGQIGLLRILRGPRSDELLEWAAYSNQNTQRLVRVILDPSWDRGAAALIRDATSAVMRPVASHSQERKP